MKCPICSAVLVAVPTQPNYEMYVAEDTGSSTECYDPDISPYKCSNGHFIYFETTGEKV